MPFHKFIDVERLGKDEVEGILIGNVTVMPKLDGANASIWKVLIPRLLETFFYEVINEELYSFVKRGNKKLDFRILRQLVISRIKETVPELF